MSGNHEEITEEIGALANQLVVNRRMTETKECIGEVKDDVSDIKHRLEKYPSILWLWFHRRKTLIAAFFVLMLMYTILFGVVNISDIRQALLHLAGLPTNLGLGPPTPTPFPLLP